MSQTSAEGLAHLRAALSAAELAQGKADMVKAVSGLLDPERADAVIAALRTPEASAILVQLRSIHGLARPVDDTMIALRRSAGPREDTSTISAALGRDSLPALRPPTGWACRPDGVWRLGAGPDGPAQVSLRPILVSGVLRALESDTRSLVLEWASERGSEWERTIVRAADTQDPRLLIRLRDLGAPVSARNARDLSDWFDQLEEANGATLPRAWQVARFGWVRGGRLGFLWGRNQILVGDSRACDDQPTAWTPDHVRLDVPPEDGRSQLAAGCRERGTMDGWRAAIALILDQPRVMIALYASLAAPYLGIIDEAPNAIIDWNGETSRGKTTTLRVAASAWGRPETTGDGLMRTWDVSPAALEQIAEMMTHMPLILDDTKRATTRGGDGASIVSNILYQVATGQGRGRGRPDGMRRTADWRTLLLSTGEAPATSFTQDAGARARVLSIVGSPLAKGSGPLVGMVTAGIIENYGHAGPAVVRHLLAERATWPDIRARYLLRVGRWTAAAGGTPVAGRLAQILALLEFGAEALHLVLEVPWPAKDPMKEALRAAIASSEDADRPTAALAALYAWAVQHEQEFWERAPIDRGTNQPRAPSRGWAGVWRQKVDWKEIAFEPETLRRVLRFSGYNPDDVIPRWFERKWMKRDGKNLGHKRTVGTNEMRCLVVPRVALDRVAGLAGPEQVPLLDAETDADDNEEIA